MLLNNEWIIVFECCPEMWNDVEKTMQMLQTELVVTTEPPYC